MNLTQENTGITAASSRAEQSHSRQVCGYQAKEGALCADGGRKAALPTPLSSQVHPQTPGHAVHRARKDHHVRAELRSAERCKNCDRATIECPWFPCEPGQEIGYGLRPIALSCGEGNGTPLQYSCLENPMDGGAW